MTWPRPSLLRRLALSFLLSSLVLGSAIVAVSVLAFDYAYGPVEALASAVAEEVERDTDGDLRLPREGALAELASENPRAWAAVRDEGGGLVVLGRPPPAALRLVAATPHSLSLSSALNFETEGAAPWSRARLDLYPTAAGPMIIAAGGVEKGDFGLIAFAGFAQAMTLFAALPVLMVLGFVLWLIVAPLVLKGVRPLAAAAAEIDGSDPARRLPEQGVMAEMLPIVKAFNGALDRLEEMLERRRRFMADAAHELRTPIAVLNMHVEGLPPGGKKPDLQRGVFRLSQLIGQMLDAERLHGPGRRREAMDLAAVVREAATEVVPLALAAGYEFDFAAGAEPVPIEGDPHAIKRAVTNLLGNAVAHGGGAGMIRVRVGADRSVEVADEGPGVAEAERERVFEPFHRERWDRDGCGLGLHLVRQIMQAHGGRAELAASKGPGACFRLVFPRAGGASG